MSDIIRLVFAFVFVLAPVAARAQAPVVNPTGVAFTCPDHLIDDEHQVGLFDETGVTLVQTIAAGDPPLTAANEVEVLIAVQPITLNRYVYKVRACAGGVCSAWSAPTVVWERVILAPGLPRPLP